MNILLLGSGGREHALAWKLKQSPHCSKLFIAPGNAGTARCGKNVYLNINDFEALGKFCKEEAVEMMIVGPEEPLVKGIADFFRKDASLASIAVIGPSGEGAQLEGSKSYGKAFMARHHIPTAAYGEFDALNYEEGIKYLQNHSLPIVLKADGLAAGKGVLICKSHVEAYAEFELMIQQNKFGDASKKVVVEEFLDGIELSVFVLTDGKNYVILPEAKDYKRVGEGDTGLNTGGMGAVSPVPFAGPDFMKKVEDQIVKPTIEGIWQENIDFKGFVFIGIIKVGDDPLVIEYNCRMGDPETEVVIPRLKNDLVELFIATWNQQLDTVHIETDIRKACTVMAVSGGYPGEYEKGFEIEGLGQAESEHTLIFHSGTKAFENIVMTNGGRVLCVTSFGSSITEAAERSRAALSYISFEEMYYRKDIGYEFIDQN
ncbi:MAG: phosphoribosylamine--glycine ligase [Chitinophagaceae bacterium]|nr:phosphoribosylamine--glycine ligase [Chitinophagaceae bacterium]